MRYIPMKSSATLLFMFFFCLLAVSKVVAQDEGPPPSQEIKKSKEKKKGPPGMLQAFKGNPGRAALYSAIFPGAGQYYNKKYWKVPIALGAEGFAIAMIIRNNNIYKGWKQGHIDLVRGDRTEYKGATTERQALSRRELWERYRDYAIIGTVAVHIIQIADAFVNRHLIEFDVDEDLSLDLYQGVNGVGLVLRF